MRADFPFKTKLVEEVLERVGRANDEEINYILWAVMFRYQELFPEWDVCTFSLPKDPEKRGMEKARLLDDIESERMFKK
jgi:hypothetical protein